MLTHCFETISLTLLPAPTPEITLDTLICSGQTVSLGDSTFTQAGSYAFTRPGQGCDTLYSLTLAVGNGITQSIDTASCGPVTLGGTTYQTGGSYTYTAAGPGCDTTYTLNLTIGDAPTVTLDTTICGGSLAVAGSVFTASGSYSFSVPGPVCDTAYALDLTILPPPATINLDTAICEGQAVAFGGGTYSQFGTYDLQVGPDGCAITYQLSITERAPVQVELDTTLCAGETLLYAGVPFTSAGVYNVNRTIGLGCDSIFTIYLSYRPANLTMLDTAILEGETLSVADTILATPGTYLFTGTAANGCDSTLRVVLDVISSTGNPLARAAGYRITNPIRSLREFRVFTAAGTQIGVSELEVFTIGGQKVGRWASSGDLPDERLASGVYVYRFRVAGDVVVGRVVVF